MADKYLCEYDKDPDAALDYGFNWTAWLETGDTILTSAWDVPSGLTLDNSSFTSTHTTVWLSGGTAGDKYLVRNRITTINNPVRGDDRSLLIRVVER